MGPVAMIEEVIGVIEVIEVRYENLPIYYFGLFVSRVNINLTFNPGGYSTRDTSSFPTQLPTKPPYTAHLGNLSYEASSESVSDFFSDCEISNVRIIEDRIEQRPKGFAYAEFHTLEGLKKALTLDGESFQGRTIKVRIADPRKLA
jgi:RNA recognition motif-containing protein